MLETLRQPVLLSLRADYDDFSIVTQTAGGVPERFWLAVQTAAPHA
jgi:hypothetical protein